MSKVNYLSLLKDKGISSSTDIQGGIQFKFDRGINRWIGLILKGDQVTLYNTGKFTWRGKAGVRTREEQEEIEIIITKKKKQPQKKVDKMEIDGSKNDSNNYSNNKTLNIFYAWKDGWYGIVEKEGETR